MNFALASVRATLDEAERVHPTIAEAGASAMVALFALLDPDEPDAPDVARRFIRKLSPVDRRSLAEAAERLAEIARQEAHIPTGGTV